MVQTTIHSLLLDLFCYLPTLFLISVLLFWYSWTLWIRYCTTSFVLLQKKGRTLPGSVLKNHGVFSVQLLARSFYLGYFFLLGYLLLLWYQWTQLATVLDQGPLTLFEGLIKVTHFSFTIQLFLALSIFYFWWQLHQWWKTTDTEAWFTIETLMLFLTASFAFLCLPNSNNFLLIYLLFELSVFCLLLVTIGQWKNKYMLEAATKFLFFTSFLSGLFVYGISILYGSIGTLDFLEIQTIFLVYDLNNDTIGLSLETFRFIKKALLLIFIGIFTKIGLVPFHFWVPDLIEGLPLIFGFYFSVIPKIAYFGLVIDWMTTVFSTFSYWLTNFLLVICFVSILGGSLAALYQTKIKRFLAYSGIVHSGYLLMPLVMTNFESGATSLFYLFIYTITSLGLFTILIETKKQSFFYELTFSGGEQKNLFVKICLSIFLLSYSGLPFLGGFFAKYQVFLSLLEGGLPVHSNHALFLSSSMIVIVLLLCTLLNSFYYFRLLKIIWFENKPTLESSLTDWKDQTIQQDLSKGTQTVLLLLANSILFTWFYSTGLLSYFLLLFV